VLETVPDSFVFGNEFTVTTFFFAYRPPKVTISAFRSNICRRDAGPEMEGLLSSETVPEMFCFRNGFRATKTFDFLSSYPLPDTYEIR
jgi:hypothetical protein